MRAPADNFHDLRLNIGMFAGLLEVLYGEKCDFFRRVFDVYQVMTHPAVSAMKGKFTPLLCRQITWAIHDNKSSFFHQRLHPDDFKGASMPTFPTSLLDDIIPNVWFQNGIHRSTFPEAWVPKPIMPPLLATPVSRGPNPFQGGSSRTGGISQGRDWYSRLGHMHSWRRECMRPFHEKFQGRVMLGRIMSAGNVSWEKLPVLDRYINQHERKNYLCYNHVLGICGHRNCRFQHATAAEIPNDFAHQLCATLRPGMD